jgi:hypothetical protein
MKKLHKYDFGDFELLISDNGTIDEIIYKFKYDEDAVNLLFLKRGYTRADVINLTSLIIDIINQKIQKDKNVYFSLDAVCKSITDNILMQTNNIIGNVDNHLLLTTILYLKEATKLKDIDTVFAIGYVFYRDEFISAINKHFQIHWDGIV